MTQGLFLKGCASILSQWAHGSKNMVFVLVKKDRTIVDCNAGFMKLAKVKKKPIGKDINDFLQQGSKIDELLLRGETPKAWKLHIGRGDLEGHILEATAIPAHDEYLVIGERPMLMGSDVVSKVATLNEQLVNLTRELSKKNAELRRAYEKIKTLEGLLPICAWCKKIRDAKGDWQKLEKYIQDHSKAEFSHGICPECLKKS